MTESDTLVNEADALESSIVLASAEWERDSENTPVYALVSTVAEVDGTDPASLPPLYHAIDPEALNALFLSRSHEPVEQVDFHYAGYHVVVRGNGKILVRSAVDA
ncbi:HalOD1 output domain-containing protein [Halovivax sp.]|uniref:HalOD1 output domain-containing protein n=1 Tax=Halovivax sp. TaxID=1935978 RepID=UPI0025B878EA|nr:HalOD1 output domain-containing protein [Halovivax sp.]